ncbi:MAG: heavy-metal-associated domain-containing protein [Salibacteraceae bacterium]
MIKYILVGVIIGFFFGCSTSASEPKVVEASFKIEGMTCQMGCANAIEEKLASLSGVDYAEVNFSENEATIKYSIEIIDRSSIVNEVESMGGGDKYLVSDYSVVKNTKTNNEIELTKDGSEEIGIGGIEVSNRISFPNIFLVFPIQR